MNKWMLVVLMLPGLCLMGLQTESAAVPVTAPLIAWGTAVRGPYPWGTAMYQGFNYTGTIRMLNAAGAPVPTIPANGASVAVGFKDTSGPPSKTAISGTVVDRASGFSSAFSTVTYQGTANWTGTNVTFGYRMDWTANVVPLSGVATMTNNGVFADPFVSDVGEVGSVFAMSDTLKAGTTLQRRNYDAMNPEPVLTVRGRFGRGSTFTGDPETLWPDQSEDDVPLPPGAVEPFTITLRENQSGFMEAQVSFNTNGEDSGFSIAFSKTAEGLKQALEAPGAWTTSDAVWTLSRDIDLGDLVLTNQRPSDPGETFAIGTLQRNESSILTFSPSAVEPVTWGSVKALTRK